ncbi:MAG: sulfate reduction electron transfer complex DsrMKJOP subunit DsrM [Chloroflexi bacterium]|nr:sulfate reduction electron transfer complex DsrMKJOP subunit DsrM [Chloroflexota bacterium]
MKNTARILYPLAAVMFVVLLSLLTLLGQNAVFIFAVVIPYLALTSFFTGFIYRVVRWAQSPVPFNIPTTCGQEASLDWVKSDKIENPCCNWGTAGRMALEILLFRSLFRNSDMQQVGGQRLVYGGSRWLWLGGLAFHWSLLIILIRHLRFFTEPIFPPSLWISAVDGVLQLALPALFITDFIILTAVSYLFVRRLVSSRVSYISLASDYLALFLIMAVVVSGVLMRSVFKVDLVAVKELAISVITFRPAVPAGIGLPFYIHLLLVCTLIAYFPFSKMMHAAGILLSPTRNLKNDSRRVMRINPWNRPVRVHTYAQYEDEFRQPMIKAGIPIEMEKPPVEQ